MTPTKTEKLVTLAKLEFDATPEELFRLIGMATVVPGICMRAGCDYVRYQSTCTTTSTAKGMRGTCGWAERSS